MSDHNWSDDITKTFKGMRVRFLSEENISAVPAPTRLKMHLQEKYKL